MSDPKPVRSQTETPQRRSAARAVNAAVSTLEITGREGPELRSGRSRWRGSFASSTAVMASPLRDFADPPAPPPCAVRHAALFGSKARSAKQNARQPIENKRLREMSRSCAPNDLNDLRSRRGASETRPLGRSRRSQKLRQEAGKPLKSLSRVTLCACAQRAGFGFLIKSA